MHCSLRQVRLAALALLLAFSQLAGAQTPNSATIVKPVAAQVEQFIAAGGQFSPAALFQPGSADETALRFAPKATFLTLDPAALQTLLAQRPAALALELSYQGQIVTVELLQTQILTEDFTVITSQSDGKPVEFAPGLHYRGMVRGDNASVAAFSFFDGEVMGMFSDNGRGNVVLGRLENPGNQNGYIIYSDREVSQSNPFSCGTEDVDMHLEGSTGSTLSMSEVSGCVRVFMEIDHALFLNKGSVSGALTYLTGAFNQLSTLYANETVSTKLSQVFIWTTPDSYSTSSSSTALNQFKAFRTSYNGDLAHLVGIAGSNLGGIAYVNTLCSPSYSYAYSDINTTYSNVPTFSWTVEVLTHEMGHNLGSNHTQWCGWSGGALDNCVGTEGGCAPGPPPSGGGTVMSYCHMSSYGINFNNGFGSQPGNLIRSKVSGASCLAATCTSSGCGAPTAITVSNITGNGATIAWSGVSGATSYSLQWRAVGAGTWNTVNPATSPYTLGGLPSSDEIEVSVQSLCGSTPSGYVNGVIFRTGSSGGGGGLTCNAPTGLNASTTSSSAALSWLPASGALSYSISWKLATSSTWGAPVNVTATAHTINNLSASTTYNVRVMTNCSGAGSTYVTGTFTTQSSGGTMCNAPANLTASPSTNSASVTWSPASGALSYKISWKIATSSTWTNAITVYSTAYTISGLTSNTTYNVRVQTGCASGVSGYTTTTFTTTSGGGGGGGCVAPSNLAVTNVLSTSATIGWSPVAGALSYDLQIKASTSSTWFTFNGLTYTSVQVTGLQANRTYQTRVRTRCGSTTYSAYSAIVSFNTPQFLGGGDEEALGLTDLPVLTIDESQARVLRMLVQPNPAHARATVAFDQPLEAGATVEVIDLHGKTLHTERPAEAAETVELDVAELAPGVYLVRAMEQGQVRAVQKLVKQ